MQQPPPTPAFDYETERRRAAVARDFTTPAIITLVLYLVLWLPGLIANIVYLLQARDTERLTGRKPDGAGCLLALAIVFIGMPILACGGIFVLFLVDGALSAGTSAGIDAAGVVC